MIGKAIDKASLVWSEVLLTVTLSTETDSLLGSTAGILGSFVFDMIAVRILFSSDVVSVVDDWKLRVESTSTLPCLKLLIVIDFKFVIPWFFNDVLTFYLEVINKKIVD